MIFCKIGAPGEIRTPDTLVRSQVLYPTELRAQIKQRVAKSLYQYPSMAQLLYSFPDPARTRRAAGSRSAPCPGVRPDGLTQLSYGRM